MYSEYFGLSERPFQLTPDPRFWFESGTHRKAMAYLGYGLNQGEGFIVITGDIGAGKTTLAGHLLASLDRTRFTALQVVSTQVEGDDMLRLVAQGLGLTTDGAAKAQLLDRIERTLDDQARAGKHVLIIVDEAQNLPTSALEELRMLSNYQVAGYSLVQIFMLGQPEFRDRLRDAPELEQLRQRVIATHHLSPMEADEIEAYILHRLGQAGYQGRPAFSGDAFATLYRATGGIPRKINTLMARILLNAAIEKLDRITGQDVLAVIEDEAADHPAPAPQPAPANAAIVSGAARVVPSDDQRVVALEARLNDQEAVLRRVLSLMIEWIEASDAPKQEFRRSGAA